MFTHHSLGRMMQLIIKLMLLLLLLHVHTHLILRIQIGKQSTRAPTAHLMRLMHFKYVRIRWIIQILNNPEQLLLGNANVIKECFHLGAVAAHLCQLLNQVTLSLVAPLILHIQHGCHLMLHLLFDLKLFLVNNARGVRLYLLARKVTC